MPELTFLSTKQLHEAYPCFSLSSLKQLASEGHPACIRKTLRPGSKRARQLWVAEWFEVWLLEGSDALDGVIRKKKSSVEKFLDELTKNPVGRPRTLSLVGGKR